jgi:phosphoglycolate phosphatase-like HAD superfamily hydrolase
MGVLYGYGDREEFEKAGATYICKDFNEILTML